MFCSLLKHVKLSKLAKLLRLKSIENSKCKIKKAIRLLFESSRALSKLKPKAPNLTVDYWINEQELFETSGKLWLMKDKEFKIS